MGLTFSKLFAGNIIIRLIVAFSICLSVCLAVCLSVYDMPDFRSTRQTSSAL